MLRNCPVCVSDDDDDKNNTVGSVAVPVRRGSKEEVKELADEFWKIYGRVFTDEF